MLRVKGCLLVWQRSESLRVSEPYLPNSRNCLHFGEHMVAAFFVVLKRCHPPELFMADVMDAKTSGEVGTRSHPCYATIRPVVAPPDHSLP